MSKCGVFFGPYFPVFELFIPNTGKYGPEKAPYSDTSRAVVFPTFFNDFFNNCHDNTSIFYVCSP